MISKLRTISWYLKQPKGTVLLANLIKRKTTWKKREDTRQQAWDWGNERAVDTDTALGILFPASEFSAQAVEQLFESEFAEARQKFEATPYQMGGAGNLTLLYQVCKAVDAKYVAETGVAYGWSSLAVLLAISAHADALLVSTDMPYAKMGNENFVGIVVPDALRKHWKLIQESDTSGLPRALAAVPYLDVAHYDSDKSYLGRMQSFPKLYAKLRSGGVFISDDIQDNLAFRDYCATLGITPVVMHCTGKLVGAFIKP